MKKLIFLLVFALLLTTTACHSEPAIASQPSVPAEQIERVVPSGPLAQMLLLALAPDLMVGIASEWNTSAEAYLTEAQYALPYTGRIFDGADSNLESLALLAPQLIIDIGETRSASEEEYASLKSQTGISTVFIPATLETMPEALRSLGDLLDREERAEQLASFCETVYQRTKTIMEKVGSHKHSVLYVLGEDGLNVIAKGSYHAEVLDALTNNAAVVESPSSKGLGNAVSMEQIALWDPDVILFAPGSIYESAAERETWSQLQAISKAQYVMVPEGPYNWMGNPPGVQRYLSLIWLPALLYPEYCEYDVKTEISAFYDLFYGCQLTDEQYAQLTATAFFR